MIWLGLIVAVLFLLSIATGAVSDEIRNADDWRIAKYYKYINIIQLMFTVSATMLFFIFIVKIIYFLYIYT